MKAKEKKLIKVSQNLLLKILIRLLPSGYYHPN